MPRIKRWFPVSQDINGDPETWEMTRLFGDRSLRTMMEIFSILDRTDNHWRLVGDWLDSLSRRVRQTPVTVQRTIDWMLARRWLEAGELLPDGSPASLKALNYGKYHVSREVKEIPHRNGTASPPSEPNLPNLPNRTLKPPIIPPRGEKKSSHAYTEGFERFWSCYPRKVGKDAAWRSWLKRRLEASTSAIVDSVNNHRTWPEWQRENGTYIPHPSTFLNQGRWKDEELAPPAARCQCGCGFELWSDAWMQQHEGGNTNTEHAFGHKTNGVTSFAAYDVDPTDPLSIDPE